MPLIKWSPSAGSVQALPADRELVLRLGRESEADYFADFDERRGDERRSSPWSGGRLWSGTRAIAFQIPGAGSRFLSRSVRRPLVVMLDNGHFTLT